MTLAVVTSRALDGLAAPPVQVEVHLANGLPSFTLVGLADTEVKEARERVRAALAQSGLAFPHNKRITVNLAPADLPKESGRFDLPIALGILAADGQLDRPRWRATSLPASCRWPASCARCAARWRWRWPRAPRAARAAPWCCRGQRGRGGAGAVVCRCAPRGTCWTWCGVAARRRRRSRCPRPCRPRVKRDPAHAAPAPTCADVRGQAAAKRALEIAAAGGAQPADGRPAGCRQVDAGAAPAPACCRRWTTPRR
jgi:magnesium chelatase family protein